MVNKTITNIIIVSLLLIQTLQFYSQYYRKCKLKAKGLELGSIKIQKSPDYHTTYKIPEPTNPRLPLDYQQLDFIYDSFIGAGGSGEVYLVEDENTGENLVLKRFFKQKINQFQTENYIMKQMNYSIGWHHDQNDPDKATIASYQYKNSVTLSQMELTPEQNQLIPVIIYKICKEILKSERKGILHHDLKMGNFLINAVGEEFRKTQVQLIDWNLAMFYYQGFQSNMKQGTLCYYSPQQKFHNQYITPASDIFALGIVLFTFITGIKPYPLNCKEDDLEAMISMIGSRRFIDFYQKYKSYNIADMLYMDKIVLNPDMYGGISLRDRIPEKFQKIFDEELVDLIQRMLQVDPEYRLTIQQILYHPYFDRVKRLPEMGKKKKQKKAKQTKNQILLQAPANNLIQIPQIYQNQIK